MKQFNQKWAYENQQDKEDERSVTTPPNGPGRFSKTTNKCIKVSNRVINLDKVSYVHFNDENCEIIINLGNDVSIRNNNNISVADHFYWYFQTREAYKKYSEALLDLMGDNFLKPNNINNNRCDVINLDKVSYIKYNFKQNKLTFNFDFSKTQGLLKICDFAHWILDSEDELYETIEYVESHLNIGLVY